jgi:hypothetical protein
MAENHDPIPICPTGRGKRMSTVSPALLYSDGSLIAPEIKTEGEPQHAGDQQENAFWRNEAECFLEALAALTHLESSAPLPAAK